MVRSTRFSRRIAVVLVALMLTLGAVLPQPTAALAGFSTSPGPALRCSSGQHFSEAMVTTRKAGKGQHDYL
jgi:hypothetical protein